MCTWSCYKKLKVKNCCNFFWLSSFTYLQVISSFVEQRLEKPFFQKTSTNQKQKKDRKENLNQHFPLGTDCVGSLYERGASPFILMCISNTTATFGYKIQGSQRRPWRIFDSKRPPKKRRRLKNEIHRGEKNP